MPRDTTIPLQYWDSCLFISFLINTEPEKVQVLKGLIDQARAGGLRIVVSNLALAEVRPSTAYDETQKEIIEDLLESNRPYVQYYGVTRAVAIRSREIGTQFPRLTVPDSIHIATALEARASVFFTYDGDRGSGRRRSGDLLGYDGQIGNPPLRIQVPTLVLGPLFGSL